ncbi:MAG: thioredoxin family protein [Deltaproteobacteria bacterium]|jgi:small redox-active disulfide protein 2|nr:TM0996/MTH895 family glutaredoxin-like protein [Smithella sp.]NMC96658.1 thioredoxin family protein [Deltaproteobacteria bacterium]
MKIEILGVGCAKCHKLEEMVRDIASKEGVNADISKVEDFKQIMNYGVMTTPALVIDGKVKAAGKIPSAEDIKKFISCK